MYLIEEQQQLVEDIKNDPEVLSYQELARSQAKGHSWFRQNIIDPIIKPILIRIFREYGDLIIKKVIEYLLQKGKL